MAKVLITEEVLQETADAIRGKTNKTAGLKPSQFAEEIENIKLGASINGILVPKTVASGSVSKGDFVCATEQVKTTRGAGEDYILSSSGSTFTDKANILDNDESTYMVINGGAYTTNMYNRIKFPSYEDIGIPADTVITNIKVTCRYRPLKSFTSVSLNLDKYTSFESNSYTRLASTNGGTSANTTYARTVSYDTLKSGDYFENMGVEIYGYATGGNMSMNVYDVKASITYLDNSQVKVATTSGDFIVGVADNNGNEGDIIDVYVSNTGEEGVSYMNRMMEIVEESQTKAQAYDILTGEEE